MQEQFDIVNSILSKSNAGTYHGVFLKQLAVLADLQLTSYWTELEFLEARYLFQKKIIIVIMIIFVSNFFLITLYYYLI